MTTMTATEEVKVTTETAVTPTPAAAPVKEDPKLLVTFQNPTQFRKGITFVAGVAPKNPTLPILGMLKVTSNGTTAIQSTDLDMFASVSFPTTAEIDGECMIPKSILMEALKGDKPLTIDLKPKLMVDLVTNGRSRKVPTIGVEESVPWPVYKPDLRVVLSMAAFKTALKQLADCASTEATRYVLNGVLLEVNPDNVTMIATDGRRLHRVVLQQEGAAPAPAKVKGGRKSKKAVQSANPQFIIPNAAVAQLLKMPVEKDNDGLIVEANRGSNLYATFTYGPYTFITKQIEGTYPNYRCVLPTEHKIKFTIPESELTPTVEHAKSATTEKNNSVKCVLANGSLTISGGSEHLETGIASSDVAVKYAGEMMSIALKPEFVLDVCKACKDQEITVKLIDELSPAVFECGNFYAVVMPMRLA